MENVRDVRRAEKELQKRFNATRFVLNVQIGQLFNSAQATQHGFEAALKINPDEAHIRSGQAQLAREAAALRQRVAVSPLDYRIAERLANTLFMALDFSEAATIYEQLVRLETPPSPRPFINLAQVRWQEGDVEAAEGLLRRCVQRWPQAADAHHQLALMYHFALSRATAARYHMETALRIDPTHPVYLMHYQMYFQKPQTMP